MKNKIIFLMLVMVLIIIPGVLGATASYYNDTGLFKIGNETFGSSANWSTGTYITGGVVDYSADTTKTQYNDVLGLQSEDTFCELFDLTITADSSDCYIAGYTQTSGANSIWAIREDTGSGDFIIREEKFAGTTDVLEGIKADGTTNHIKICRETNFFVNVSVNNTPVGRVASDDNGQLFAWGRAAASFTSCTFTADNWVSINNTEYVQTSSPPPPPVDDVVNNTKPNVTITYPVASDTIDNFTYPIEIIGNATVQNGTITSVTINDTNFNNVGTLNLFNFTVNGTVTETVYNLNVTAISNHGNQTSQEITFTIDFTNPDILNTNFDTPIFHYIHGENLSILVNATDNHLIYSINVSTNGYVMNISGINSVDYIYNQSFNTSTFSLGSNSLEVGLCDAHTANKIPKWDIEKDNNKKKIKYKFATGHISVEPLISSDIINYDTQKQKDRYNFIYEQNTPATISFIVKSNYFIDIIGNREGYNGWLVIPALNKWVDFNLLGITSEDYIIERLKEKEVKVTILNAPKNLEFESIGELNCNFQTYTYYLYNYSVEYENTPLETSTQSYKYILDYPEPYNIEVDLIHNGTRYDTVVSGYNHSYSLVIPEINITTQPINFYWNFTLNETQNVTPDYTTTYNSIVLDTCTELTNSTKTLNISLYDEQDPGTLINGNVQGTFYLYTDDSDVRINTTISLSGASQYSLCLYPNATITTDANLFYNTTGGYTQRWFLNGATLSNTTTLLDMFNFASTTGLSDVRGILRDTSYDFYSGLVAKLLRFYPGENLYRVVQMDKSDDFGQILFHVLEENTDYIVTFENGGTELDRTNPLKFICTTGICDVTFVVEETTTTTTSDIGFLYGYDNVSQVFQLNWSESTGLTDTVRLRISKLNSAGTVDICDTTVSSSTGIINCNTTGYTGLLTARVYTTQSPEKEILLVTIEKLVDKFYQLATLDKNEVGLWAVGISIILSTAGLLVSIVVGVMLYIASLIVIYYLGLLSFLTVAYITISVVLGIIVIVLVRK